LTGNPDVQFNYSDWSPALIAELEQKSMDGELLPVVLGESTFAMTFRLVLPPDALEQTHDLIQAVADLPIHHGIRTSLLAQLAAVEVALAEEDQVIASHALQAFIQHVKAQKGKKLTEEQANSLVADAEQIGRSASNTKRRSGGGGGSGQMSGQESESRPAELIADEPLQSRG
jgi:hypothetical protein